MFLDATTGPWERVPHAVHGSLTLRHRCVLLIAYTGTIVVQVHRGEHDCTQVACPWQYVQTLFPQARQVLDYDHCAHYVYNIAKAHYGTSLQGLEWAEATMTRLYLGQVSAVLGGLRRMQPTSDEAAQAITPGWAFLNEHRGHTN